MHLFLLVPFVLFLSVYWGTSCQAMPTNSKRSVRSLAQLSPLESTANGPRASVFAPRTSSLRKERALLVIVASLYGLDYSMNKVLQQRMLPEVIIAIKYGLSSLVFLPGYIHDKGDFRTLRVGVELGIWCTIYAISIARSIQGSPASKVSFFAALGVVMPPLYDWVSKRWNSRKEMTNIRSLDSSPALLSRLVRSPFVAPFLAMMGVYLMGSDTSKVTGFGGLSSGGGGGGSTLQGFQGWQDALLLVGPVASSLCYWRSERMAAFAPYSPSGATAVMLGTVALLTSAYCGVVYGPVPVRAMDVVGYTLMGLLEDPWAALPALVSHLLERHGTDIALLLASSLLVTGWNTVTEQRVLRTVSAAEAYVVLSLEPLFAALFATLLLGERVGGRTALAGGFIVAACLWRSFASYLVDKAK